MRTEVLVVGSGAGGATTAAVLAAAGVDVLIVEEGPEVAPGLVKLFRKKSVYSSTATWVN